MKKFVSLLLALVMVLSLAACGSTANENSQAPVSSDAGTTESTAPEVEPYTGLDWEALNAMDHEDRSDTIYNEALGEFADVYAAAKEKSGAERLAMMAIADAKLLESGAFLPMTTRGGNYAMSRVVPRTVPTNILWGMDEYRYENAIVTNELLKKEDVATLRSMWAEADTASDYFAAARAFLDENGYTLSDTYTITNPYNVNIWDVVGTSYTSDAMFIAGTYDNLMHYDVKGVQQPALATSYEVSDDGLTYTFHIREGVKWMDQQGTEIGEVTADDWVAAMEHLLDNADELGYLLTVDEGCGLKGFDAYLAGEATFEDVGVKAVDKYTLEYTLEAPFPPFPSMLGYSIFAPLNRDFYRSQGGTFGAEGEVYTAGDFGKTPSNIAYCGPYLITNHTAQNVTRYEANPNYWNADAVAMKTIVYAYNDGSDATRSYNEAKSGTISGAGFNSEALQAAKSESPEGETATYFDLYAYVTDGTGTTYCGWMNMNRTLFTNYDNDGIGISPKKDDEDAIARTRAAMVNQHFRLAVLMGLDRGAYNAQRVGEDLKFAAIRNSYTPGTFQVLAEDVTVDINGTATSFPAGTFFGEIEQAQLDADGVPIKVWDAATSSGDGFDGWYNAANAAAELELAIAELAQVGVDITAENPIYIDYPYETYNNTAVNCAQAIKKSVEEALGSKVIINLVGFDKDTDYESCTYRFANGMDTNFDLSTGSGWGPDYGDAQSYLDTVQYGAYMCKNMGLF